MGDSDQDKVVATLKAYLKLCAKPSHRSVILKDQSFLHVLKTLIKDDRVVVMTYLIKILLHLTEYGNDAEVLSTVPGFEQAVSLAAEKSFPPNIIYNMLVVVSRLKGAQDRMAQNKAPSTNPLSNSVGGCGGVTNGTGTIPRKFVTRKSKQLIYEFDELWEDLKFEIERRVLAMKGVISLYFSSSCNRVTIRTIPSVDAHDITDLLFDCGCEMVTQVVNVDGVDEYFKMYASEREKKAVVLPDYLDDMDVLDPKSCIVTNDFLTGRKNDGGWFSTISSFVKSSLW
ncbi:hypothetical protein RB195_006863 [Necator americanus]|uniref:Uncharacterized protein n=2 Tax=Necator americanus TaxID=51031 RepID=W2TU06_NECAM|nr:hypothetical protein NECAME_06822 [Necator americanus]ETN84586.1 hypothetical protein NECAME_06822 [Necator americanus]